MKEDSFQTEFDTNPNNIETLEVNDVVKKNICSCCAFESKNYVNVSGLSQKLLCHCENEECKKNQNTILLNENRLFKEHKNLENVEMSNLPKFSLKVNKMVESFKFNESNLKNSNCSIDKVTKILKSLQIHPNECTNKTEIQEIIEKNPQNFYFKCEPNDYAQYYHHLISLNPSLNIDDLIYENIARIHKKSINLQDKGSILRKICFILKNKVFSRIVLRHIFDNIVYIDYDRSIDQNISEDITVIFYKYSILNQIIQQYKNSDNLFRAKDEILTNENLLLEKIKNFTNQNEISNGYFEIQDSSKANSYCYESVATTFGNQNKNQLIPRNETECSNIGKSIYDYGTSKHCVEGYNYLINTTSLDEFNKNLIKMNKLHSFIKDIDIGKDNTEVLSNIIWENTIYILEMLPIASITDSESYKNLEKSNFRKLSNAEVDLFEANCIVSLYKTIILETGQFFENRILRNSNLFSKICSTSNFLELCDAVISNFSNSKKLIEVLGSFLTKINSTSSDEMLKKLQDAAK